MSSQDASYLNSLKGAQSFLSMDRNLLRFPEVVLERIQIKIEDDPDEYFPEDPAAFLIKDAGEEAEHQKAQKVKVEDLSDENQQKAGVSYYTRAGEEAEPKKAQKVKVEDLSDENQQKAGVSYYTRGEEAEPKKAQKVKVEDLSDDNQQKAGVSYYTRVGDTVYRSRGGRLRKDHGAESGRQGNRLGNDGSLGEMEKSGVLRRGGKKRRGGWHHYLHRERPQRPKKRESEDTYVEEERQRGHRFSEEENAVLVTAVLDHYIELCGQSSIKGSATRKRRLWQEVANQVNKVDTTYRSIEVCKKRYGDCRRTVKLKMAALEKQRLGRGDPQEQIRFNHWEEQLRRKIASVIADEAAGRVHQVLDTGEPTTLDTNDSNSAETSSSQMWIPTAETPGCAMAPSGDTLSEGEEATSPQDVQVMSEWSEEEGGGAQARSEKEAACPEEEGGQYVAIPEAEFLEQVEEEHRRSLRQLSRAHTGELHKLRDNVVEGNARVVQQLESLASEVRELNAHVRQIHMHQAHFNLMFQNYLSDTKQFYGAMVQNVRNLQQAPSVSPIATPAPSPTPTPHNALLQTPVTDYGTLSPAGSAEPASASSTASELPVYSSTRYQRRTASAFHARAPNIP